MQLPRDAARALMSLLMAARAAARCAASRFASATRARSRRATLARIDAALVGGGRARHRRHHPRRRLPDAPPAARARRRRAVSRRARARDGGGLRGDGGRAGDGARRASCSRSGARWPSASTSARDRRGRGWRPAFAAFLLGRWRDARPWFAEAESIFRERCTGCAWELDSVDLFSLWTRYYLGELGELGARCCRRACCEATARGDRYGVTNLRAAWRTSIALAADDPAPAAREASEAVAAWSHPGFHAQHYYQLFAQAEADLYRGDAAGGGASSVTRALAGAARSRSCCRCSSSASRRCTCARARAGGGAHRRRRRRRARAGSARRRAAHRARAHAVGDAAGDAGPRGRGRARRRPARAASLCELAARELDAAGMALYATVARWRLGHIIGGGDGYALVTAANEWMQTQKVREPRRLAAVLAPGFAD